jgi:hypothetical protein
MPRFTIEKMDWKINGTTSRDEVYHRAISPKDIEFTNFAPTLSFLWYFPLGANEHPLDGMDWKRGRRPAR